ncbi:MAG: hypothetical protein ACOXZS_01395 [Bacilli bacterium]|jgi:hypothetical protein
MTDKRNDDMMEVKKPQEADENLHPAEKIVADNADNLAKAEVMFDEKPLKTEHTVDYDEDIDDEHDDEFDEEYDDEFDDGIDEDYYGDGDEGDEDSF